MTPYEKHRKLIVELRYASPERTERIKEILRADLDRIIGATSDATGLSPEEIRDESRRRDLVEARHMISYVAVHRGHALERVGRMLGNRHHATILNGRNRIEEWMENEDEIVDTVNEIFGKL